MALPAGLWFSSLPSMPRRRLGVPPCWPVVVNDVTRSALVTDQPTVEFRLGAGYEWLSDEQIVTVIECTTHALDRFLVMKLRLTCDHSSWRTSP